MCKKSFAFLCCGFILLITSSSKSQQNSTNVKKNENLTVHYEINTNSTIIHSNEIKTVRYDLYEMFINNTQYDEMQNKFRTISMNNDRENVDSVQYKLSKHSVQNYEDDEQILMESHTNPINVDHERNLISQEVYENLIVKNDSVLYEVFENSSKDGNESNVVPYEMCETNNITCIWLCCSLGHRLDGDECIPNKTEHLFPYVYTYANDSIQSKNERVDEFFPLAIHDPNCIKTSDPENYIIFSNGSIYLLDYDIFVESTSYCLAVGWDSGNEFQLSLCIETLNDIFDLETSHDDTWEYKLLYPRIVCVLIFILMFFVYSILPEFRNMHGFTMRNYCGALIVAYTIEIMLAIFIFSETYYDEYFEGTPICVIIDIISNFFHMSANFWLIMISFDMWRTFRKFDSLQKSIRKQEKKLMYYAIYAWGCPFILNTFRIIMEFVSDYVPEILEEEFQLGQCWIYREQTLTLFFYNLRDIGIISGVCLSIYAVMKIVSYEKDSRLHLTDLETKRYNESKKWLYLYRRLFIVLFNLMIIRWIMTVLALITDEYISDFYINMINYLQHIYTFIIFVCKKKIMLMLFKRFSCDLFPQVQCDMNAALSSASEIPIPMGNMNSHEQENRHAKATEEIDCIVTDMDIQTQ